MNRGLFLEAIEAGEVSMKPESKRVGNTSGRSALTSGKQRSVNFPGG